MKVSTSIVIIKVIISSLILAGIALATMPGPALASDWPLFHMDSYNHGVTTDPGPLSLDGERWVYGVSWSGMAGIDVAPIVGDSKVYFVSFNGSVYALNFDGSLAWRNKSLGGQDSFIIGNPAYHDHVLYVTMWQGNKTADTGIHAIDTDTGRVIWSNNNFIKCQPITPVLYDDGMLYFGTWQGHTAYYGINATDGAIVWERNSTTGGGYYWAGATVIGDFLVYGDEAGYLTSVTRETGETVDQLDVSETFGIDSQEIRSSIAFDPEKRRIYFTSHAGYCYCVGFDARTGRFQAADHWKTYISFLSTSTPAIYNGRLYVGSGTFATAGNLYCLEVDDGSVVWTFETDGGVQASPAISIMDGKPYIYFTSNYAYGSAYCLDGNGKEIWEFTPPEDKAQYMLCGVAISDGWAFFGNDRGNLFAFGSGEAADGTPSPDNPGPSATSAAGNGPLVSLLIFPAIVGVGLAMSRRAKK